MSTQTALDTKFNVLQANSFFSVSDIWNTYKKILESNIVAGWFFQWLFGDTGDNSYLPIIITGTGLFALIYLMKR